jgi:hypothetical protein
LDVLASVKLNVVEPAHPVVPDWLKLATGFLAIFVPETVATVEPQPLVAVTLTINSLLVCPQEVDVNE